MSASHTPGEWSLDKSGDLVTDEHALIAHVYFPDEFNYIHHDDAAYEEYVAECEANARLIVAAPKLVQHLQRVLGAWRYEANQGDGVMEDHYDILQGAEAFVLEVTTGQSPISNVSAAITKATGGQS